MTEPKPLPSETKLVERLKDRAEDFYDSETRPDDTHKLLVEAAAALASLADELWLARTELKGCYRLIDELKEELRQAQADARRYRWLQDWYLREGKRSEIDEFGHIRQTTALIMDASIDAAASGPKEG